MTAPWPCLFDIAIGAFLIVLSFIKSPFYQRMFFVFGIIFLICLTFSLKPKANYKSLPLSLLALWSLSGVFIHSFYTTQNSIINSYINASLMFEGFIFIFLGILFLFAIINYSKSVPFLYLVISISSIPWLKEMLHAGRITPVLALVSSVIAYLALKQKFILLLIILAVVIPIIFLNWNWVVMKFKSRPVLWRYMAEEIKEHPYVGKGFNKSLQPDNMVWVKSPKGPDYGWLYNHNDYLNIASCLGLPALLFIISFCLSSFLKIGNNLALIPFLTVVILCFFQMTMPLPSKAALVLTISALSLKMRR